MEEGSRTFVSMGASPDTSTHLSSSMLDTENASFSDHKPDVWQVVKSKRVSRAWEKQLRTLDKHLGDMYEACRQDCSVIHADAVISRLQVFLLNFKVLKSQIQEVWGEPGDAGDLEELDPADLDQGELLDPTPYLAYGPKPVSQSAGGGAAQHSSLIAAKEQRSWGGALTQSPTPGPSPSKGPIAALAMARSLPGSRLPSKRSPAPSEPHLMSSSSSGSAFVLKEGSPDRLRPLSTRTSSDHSQQQPTASSVLSRLLQAAASQQQQAATAPAAADAPGSSRASDTGMEEGGGSSAGASQAAAPWKAKVDWTLLFRRKPIVLPSPLKLPLHEKLLSPGRRRSPQETKQASDERHARAGRLREAIAEQRQARMEQRKQKGKAAKSIQEERVELIANRCEEKIARSTELRQQHIAGIVQRAGEEGRKVAEVAFINQLLEEDKKLSLQQKMEEGEARRRERLGEVLARQKEAAAAAEEAAGRRREAEDKRREELATRLAVKDQRKQMAQARLDEERRLVAAAREAARERQAQLLGRVAAQQQQEQVALGEEIEERLREAAARRQQRLELISERAALGAAQRAEAAGPGTETSSGATPHLHLPTPKARLPLSASAAPFYPNGPSAPASSNGEAVSLPPATSSSLPLALLTSTSLRLNSPTRSTDRSITLARTPQSRLRGMRKRACKLARQMHEASLTTPCAEPVRVFLSSTAGKALSSSWSSAAGKLQSCSGDSLVPAATALLQQINAELDEGLKQGRALSACAASSSELLLVLADTLVVPEFERSSSLLINSLTLLLRLLESPSNCAHLAGSGRIPGLVRMCMRELDTCNSRPSHGATATATGLMLDNGPSPGTTPRGTLSSSSQQQEVRDRQQAQEEHEYEQPLALLMQVLTVMLSNSRSALGCTSQEEAEKQGSAAQPSLEPAGPGPGPGAAAAASPPWSLHSLLSAYYLACGLVGRSAELVSLMDQPRTSSLTRPIPQHIVQGLRLLEVLTTQAPMSMLLLPDRRWQPSMPNAAAISLAFSETSLAGLPSMLTAILLHAAPSCVPADASPSRLPSNFVPVATLVMRVLNNVARLDLIALQTSLGSGNLGVEFLHLIGFLLIYCTTQWTAEAAHIHRGEQGAAGAEGAASGKGSAGPSAQGQPQPQPQGICSLLNEVLLLVGYFSVLAPHNQVMLSWGRHPSVLHSLCNLPFDYWATPALSKVLFPTLVSVCYGDKNICSAVSQHISLAWLLQDLTESEAQGHAQVLQVTPTGSSGAQVQQSGPEVLGRLLDKVDLLLQPQPQPQAQAQGQAQGRPSSVDPAQWLSEFSFQRRFPTALRAAARSFFEAARAEPREHTDPAASTAAAGTASP